MQYKIEMIRWVDSMGFSGWRSVPSDAELDDIEHVSVGLLVAETDRVVGLAGSVGCLYHGGPDNNIAELHTIPKCAILTRTVLGSVDTEAEVVPNEAAPNG